MPPTADIPYRLTVVEAKTSKQDDRIDVVEKTADRLDLELHGERGIYKVLEAIEKRFAGIERKLFWVNSAMWAIAVAITGTAVTIILKAG